MKSAYIDRFFLNKMSLQDRSQALVPYRAPAPTPAPPMPTPTTVREPDNHRIIQRVDNRTGQHELEYLIFANIIFPFVICPLMLIIGVPILMCFYVPYLVHKHPKLLLFLPMYTLYTLRIYGKQRLLQNHPSTERNQINLMLGMFGKMCYRSLNMSSYLTDMKNYLQRIHIDRNFLKITIYTDAREQNLHLIFTDRRDKLIQMIRDFDPLTTDSVQTKMECMINEIMVLERVLHTRHSIFLPIKDMFKDMFDVAYRTKKRYIFEILYNMVRHYKAWGHNSVKRFHSVDAIFCVQQFVMDVIKREDFLTDVQNNSLCVAECFDHVSLRYFLEEDVQNYCIDTDSATSYISLRPHFRNDRDRSEMFKRCCREDKPNMAKAICEEDQINFNEEYQAYTSLFIECCEKGMINICVIISQACDNLKINGIESIDGKIVVRYTILPPPDTKSVTSVAKRLGIKNMIDRSDIGNTIVTRGDSACIVCRSDSYNVIIRCGHTYCLTCVDEWYFQHKHDKRCVGCTVPFTKMDIYVIR